MIEWVVVARDRISYGTSAFERTGAYLSVLEKIPLSNLMLVIHAVLISAIIAISNAGRSDMTHVHASMPAAIADGVKTSKGRATM
jgi:hypothetical protein